MLILNLIVRSVETPKTLSGNMKIGLKKAEKKTQMETQNMSKLKTVSMYLPHVLNSHINFNPF